MKRDTDYSNDNDELPFESIGLAAMLILNKLRLATQLEAGEEGQEQKNGNAKGSGADQQHRAADKEYVERRLADLREFERRAKGIQKLR